MKYLLVALNAKYIHSNLAIYYLKSYCQPYKDQIELGEYTINEYTDDIIGDIYKKKPDFIGFSCYIWNIEMIKEVARELRKVLPNTKMWFGGPEVSYDAATQLENNGMIDGIMVGEGEETFLDLVTYYEKQEGSLKDIAGIVYRDSAKNEYEQNGGKDIVTTGVRGVMNLSKVPFPYDDMDKFKNKIIYYETSRGCPYSCSYCLSSIDKSVRFRDMELVKKELQMFLDYKVPQVKFIDRTFNAKRSHTLEIWQYLYEHDNGITNFHFEISADILNDEELTLLNKMREGLVQLEIGVQSTNAETIEAIHRTMDLKKLKYAVDRVHEGKNIHQHLDLIIGLPYEDYQTFSRSFNEVYAMHPNQLQVGFLKVLKGSYMHDVCDQYHIVYKDQAPYEVMYTDWISFDEVLKLKQVEEMVEQYYNSGQFTYSMQYLEHCFVTPFELYETLSEFYEENGMFAMNYSRVKKYEILLHFYEQKVGKNLEAFVEILTFDLYLREKMKSRPAFIKDDGNNYKKILRNRNDIPKVSMMHVEHFTIDPEETARTGQVIEKEHYLMFNYDVKSKLDHNATLYDLGMLTTE